MQTTIQHPLDQATLAPEIRAIFDDMDVFIADRQDLLDLYKSVNDVQIRAFLVGIIETRDTLAQVTGRPF